MSKTDFPYGIPGYKKVNPVSGSNYIRFDGSGTDITYRYQVPTNKSQLYIRAVAAGGGGGNNVGGGGGGGGYTERFFNVSPGEILSIVIGAYGVATGAANNLTITGNVSGQIVNLLGGYGGISAGAGAAGFYLAEAGRAGNVSSGIGGTGIKTQGIIFSTGSVTTNAGGASNGTHGGGGGASWGNGGQGGSSGNDGAEGSEGGGGGGGGASAVGRHGGAGFVVIYEI